MTTVSQVTPPHDLERDQRVTLHGVSWEQFEAVLAMRGDSSGVRLTYLRGELELMSPSEPHEGIKKCIARLLEMWSFERGVDLRGVGSWTIRREEEGCGLEPDECYVVGGRRGVERPDLAIEVVWTSGGLDKLEVYRGLEVPEVWVWRDGRIEIWHLVEGAYARQERSVVLPTLDVGELTRFVDPFEQAQAVRNYVAALRGGPDPGRPPEAGSGIPG